MRCSNCHDPDPFWGDGLLGEGDGLGDILCTEGDCTIGKALVLQLVKFFDGVHRPKKWEPTVMALYGAWEQAEAGLSRKIPFSPACCTIKELGDQAQRLQRQIADDLKVGAPPTIETKGASTAILSREGIGTTAILAGLAGLAALAILRR